MVRAFTLAYGREYQECLSEFLNYLQGLHERDDHRFPFSFVADAWEEMFWRRTEEVRHSVAVLLKTLGKESVRKEEFVMAALTPRADGSGPALGLPLVWDYRDPQGYFQAVIIQRLNERATRAWWDHTHKASLKQPRKTGEDGAGRSEKMEDGDRRLGGTGTQLYPAGKPLSKQEA